MTKKPFAGERFISAESLPRLGRSDEGRDLDAVGRRPRQYALAQLRFVII
jgi:hypothetical protein